MRLLLDTHVFLWWMTKDETLHAAARHAIADPVSVVVVSAAVAWEIGIKRSLGKLEAPEDISAQLRRHAFGCLTVTVEHAVRSGGLPPHHRDPFDRMLVAQAQLEGLTIVTRDENIPRYDVATLAA
jgi:PIN domain nuclease of toxin-antitoxin system